MKSGFFSKEIESQKGRWESLSHILGFCMLRSGLSPNSFCWSGAGSLSPPAWCIPAHPSGLHLASDGFKPQKHRENSHQIKSANGRAVTSQSPPKAVEGFCEQSALSTRAAAFRGGSAELPDVPEGRSCPGWVFAPGSMQV